MKTSDVEPELLLPTPRPISRRGEREAFILRLCIIGPLALFVLYVSAPIARDALTGWAGTPVTVQVLGWESDQHGFRAMLAWPRRGWDGVDTEARLDLRPSGPDAVRLRGARTIPAWRLGRGGLQFLVVRPNGTPIDVEAMAWGAVVLVGVANVGVAFILAPWLTERWLIARGRPVRGIVTARAKSETRRPEYTVSYKYWELGEPGTSPTLMGTSVVSRQRFEQVQVGEGVTVLHALWNPRTHVAYSLLREIHRGRGVAARGPSQS